MLVKCGTLADLMVAVADGAVSAFDERSEIGFAGNQRQRHQITSIAVQQIKHKTDKGGATSLIGKPQ